MKERRILLRGGDSLNRRKHKAPFFFPRSCATEDFTKGAANACGCLVGVWQPYRDVIVTSGNAAMPEHWEAALQV